MLDTGGSTHDHRGVADPRERLRLFLREAFDTQELRRVIRRAYPDLLDADLPEGGVTLEELIASALEKLRHHGVLTQPDLYVELIRARPKRAEEVVTIAGAFGLTRDAVVGPRADRANGVSVAPVSRWGWWLAAAVLLMAATSLVTLGVHNALTPEPRPCDVPVVSCPEPPAPRECPAADPCPTCAVCTVCPTCEPRTPGAKPPIGGLPPFRLAKTGLIYDRNDLPASQVADIVRKVRPKLATFVTALAPCFDATPLVVSVCPAEAHILESSNMVLVVDANGEVARTSAGNGCALEKLFGKAFPEGKSYPGRWSLRVEWPRKNVMKNPQHVCADPRPGPP